MRPFRRALAKYDNIIPEGVGILERAEPKGPRDEMVSSKYAVFTPGKSRTFRSIVHSPLQGIFVLLFGGFVVP